MFRLLDRYLIREIVPYTLLCLLLLTAIVFAHEASRFSEILVVSTKNGLPMEALGRLLAALIPGIIVFTLPISLLVGILVGLGRMSGDSEIIALVAGGLSRTRLLRPVLALALLCTAAMLYITFVLLPDSVSRLNHLKDNQALVFQGLNTQVKPRVFEESIPGRVLYVEDIDRSNDEWHNVFLVDLGDEKSEMRILTASSGFLRQSTQATLPALYLKQVSWHQVSDTRNIAANHDDDDAPEKSSSQIAAKPASKADATAAKEVEKDRKRNRNQQYGSGYSEEMTLGIVNTEPPAQSSEDEVTELDIREMQWSALLALTPLPNEARKWRAELHRRLVYPAACLVFAVLGLAFGIGKTRTGRSFGLLLGLAITVLYYLIALSGENAAISGKLPTWMGMWMANTLLLALGIISIYLQRQPGSDPLSLFTRLAYRRSLRREEEMNRAARPTGEEQAAEAELPRAVRPRRRFGWARMPQLLDRLVLSDLSRFFFFIVSGFSLLFIIITLFQLLDSITRNRIEWSVVANYLFFLLPMIVNYVTPIAALVAVMITFGLLQKTSQVVALKASGQSVYRLAMPVVLASLLLSAFVYFNQDYVLPFTNRRQNNLRYLIRKGQEPPQTFFQTKNQWIFGLDSRIFNYEYFDINKDAFLRLNIMVLSRQPFSITRRLYARRASWDAQTQEWILENGWERQFAGEKVTAYEPFKQRRLKLSERPEYFKKDSRGASSMTLAELRRKIDDLAQSGFDVLDLRIALQSKIAFPLACLIMVLVGLPFSFSIGKRGALYGVAIGIAIGLTYWGSLGLFEQMGRYELLPPLLAAWGPNMLFGAGGFYLFLTSRT